MSDEIPTFSIPLRRMTQAELDAFLEKAADILRGNVDHSEFRGYVFALLFFKRISDIFEEAVRNLAKQVGEELANDPAMQKKSLPFVVPPDSTWEAVTVGTPEKKVTSLQLGQSLNDAMLAIEYHMQDWDDGTVREAARQLKVSAQALAIRVEELNKAPAGMSRRFVVRMKPRAAGKVSYVTRHLSEIGGRYTASVIGAMDRDIIDVVHASEALALRPSSLEDARAYVDRQRVLASGE
jgi:hypothetical protein